jgi:integrase
LPNDPVSTKAGQLQGINAKIVSERLGHANIAITLDTYAHVLPSMQQEAAAGIDAALFGGDPGADVLVKSMR